MRPVARWSREFAGEESTLLAALSAQQNATKAVVFSSGVMETENMIQLLWSRLHTRNVPVHHISGDRRTTSHLSL